MPCPTLGVFTAPAILMATQQLINTGLMSTSIGSMLLGSGLDTAAIVRLLVGMPDLCSSAVAGASAVAGLHSASKRMLHRTSPLNEFVLSPLFLPSISTKECSDFPDDEPQVTKRSCLVVFKGDCTDQEIQSEDIHMESSVVIIEEVDVVNKVDGLKPVFFLIPGHVGNETDLRGIFGGIPEVHDLDDSTATDEPLGLGESINFTAETAIESVVDVVEDDVDKLSSLINGSTVGSKNNLSNSQFVTLPHLVRKNWWRDLFPRGEEYILQWERTELADLNMKIRNILEGKLIGHVVNAALAHFALTALWSSFSWANFVLDELAELDGPWAVALDRSKQAGRILARLLLSNKFCQIESEEVHQRKDRTGCSQDNHANGADGVVVVNGDTFSWDDCSFENIRRGRPVTLIGYSMGARVIYHCLQELDACVPSAAGRGIVENVVLMGAPVSTDFASWSACRRVVSGRLINCYSRKDWFLALMYRTNMYEPTVAGLQPFSLTKSVKFGIESAGLCFMTPSSSAHEELKLSPEDLTEAACVNLEEEEITRVTEEMKSWSGDVECVDISGIIKSHADYPNQLHAILHLLKLEPEKVEYTTTV